MSPELHPLENETSGQYRIRMEDWRGEERRNGSGWTIWKEIYGTFIGFLPFAVMFFIWITNIDKQTALNTADIAHLRESRVEVVVILSDISKQIATLQQSVAKLTR